LKTKQVLIQPVSSTERIHFIDVLRGFALFGILGLNLSLFWGNDFLTDVQQQLLPAGRISAIFQAILHLFIENKFLGLFALLFGISFSLQLERANDRGVNGTPTFLRRIGWLFVIGAIHGWLFWWGDILRFYAIWGLTLPLFARLRKKTILVFALFFAVISPAVIELIRGLFFSSYTPGPINDTEILTAFSSGSYTEMVKMNWQFDWWLSRSISQLEYQTAILGRLLLGLWIGRVMLFHDLDRNAPFFQKVLFWGGIAAAIGNISFAIDFMPVVMDSGYTLVLRPLIRLINETGFLGLTICYAAGLALLYRIPVWKRWLNLLAPVGKTALSNYLFQTLIGLWLFYGFFPGPRLMGKFGLVIIIPIWMAVYIIQLVISTFWFGYFRFGPFEWAWRSLTYRKIQPLRAQTLQHQALQQ
jgi:uncharacterized protein